MPTKEITYAFFYSLLGLFFATKRRIALILSVFRNHKFIVLRDPTTPVVERAKKKSF